MKSQSIPARRKFYCKRGIIDVLIGKGEYLLKEKDKMFLVKDEKKEQVIFIKMDYRTLLAGWKFDGYRKDMLWIISFDLKADQFSSTLGRKIQDTLERLERKGVKFGISKPLPPCIFKEKASLIKKYRIPLHCKDCLELFIVSKNGKDNLFCGYKIKAFMFQVGGRFELAKLLSQVVGVGKLKVCKTCKEEKTCEFWLWRANCYGRRKIKSLLEEHDNVLALNGWLVNRFQKILIPWWFWQYEWKIDPHMPSWQRLLKHKLEDEWIVDAGGAHGRNSFGLYKISKKTALVDIGRAFFKYTQHRQRQKRVYFPIVNADITQMPFKNNSVRLIYSGGVLHAMPDKDKMKHLKDCYRMLKPEGLFAGLVMAEWEVGKPPGVWPVTYKKDLICLLKKSGFNSIKILSKNRLEGWPQQGWFFMAGKSLSKQSKRRRFCNLSWWLNRNYFLRPNCWTIPLFYKRKLFALYHLQKERYHMLVKSPIQLWRMLKQQNMERLVSHLNRKSEGERECICRELENLVRAGFLNLYKEMKNGQKKEQNKYQ